MAVGDVVCVGVTSGELIATLFFRGLGDTESIWFGETLSGSTSCISISVVSWLVGGYSSSCWGGFGIGRGICGLCNTDCESGCKFRWAEMGWSGGEVYAQL